MLYVKIIGYGTLWAIVFALVFAICMILKEGHVEPDGTKDGSDVVAGKVGGHPAAETSTPAPKPLARAALPSV